MPPRAVVVTGASTGIGRATVLELVGAGFQVFGTVRREADAESLRQQFPELVRPLIMDLLDEDSVRTPRRSYAPSSWAAVRPSQ